MGSCDVDHDLLATTSRPNSIASIRICHLHIVAAPIEPNKLADLAVLDRDYMTIPVEDVGNIQAPPFHGARQKATYAVQQNYSSITSSAMASTPGGIVRPSVFAVFRLMIKSNLESCTTGRSIGFSPLRMRPA